MDDRRKVVVKVGTSTLCHGGKGLNFRNIDALANTLTDIKNAGNDVILVSSGAIGAGVSKLGLPKRPTQVRFKQAVAAVGQCELMHIYDKFFGEYGATVGQVLFTRDDMDRPTVRQNLISTFEALLSLHVIPVVNENDSVCIEEIESEHKVFGDNDTLSAVVASLISADLLLILTDIDGLYDSDPRRDPGARLISEVREIDEAIIAKAGGVGSGFGTGGMATKIAAAKFAMEEGIDVVITNGSRPQDLYTILDGGRVGTRFVANQ